MPTQQYRPTKTGNPPTDEGFRQAFDLIYQTRADQAAVQASVAAVVQQTATIQTTTAQTVAGKQAANTVLAGPTAGPATAAPAFRMLVPADVPNLAILNVSAAATLSPGTLYVFVNTTGGGFTIKLPLSPQLGEQKNFKHGIGVNALVIDGNGKTIDGASTLTINTAYTSALLMYNGTEWSVI